MAQKEFEFKKEITESKELKYLLYLPDEYDQDLEKSYPLVLFLHGAGERGDDLEMVKRHGPPKLAEKGKLPYILLSPQCPLEIPRYSNWISELSAVMELLNETAEKYRVDQQRIYVTGLSMGGYGTWELGKRYPDRFAAIAPICGGGSLENIVKLKDVPVWAFHGGKDDVVLPEESAILVDALSKSGGNVRYTVYPEENHDSWTKTYSNPEFYEWLLSQRKL